MRQAVKTILVGGMLILALIQGGCSVDYQEPIYKGVPLSQEIEHRLADFEWTSRVGSKIGIWISVTDQRLYVIRNRSLLASYVCSTAKAGTGSERDSGRTPLGWHRVAAKIGHNLPVGAILKDRKWTREIWQPGQETSTDLILSRILWLDGLEKGINRGGAVDSKKRYIYIHGTNGIKDLGYPASSGCIRMEPAEVIELFDMVPSKCQVLITNESDKLIQHFDREPFINPSIIEDLAGWLSDSSKEIVAINLCDAQDNNRYSVKKMIRQIEGYNPFVYFEKDEGGFFGYRLIGQAESGLYVLETSMNGGGSGIFKSLILVDIVSEKSLSYRKERSALVLSERTVVKKVGSIELGDRYRGKIEVEGDSLYIGKDENGQESVFCEKKVIRIDK